MDEFISDFFEPRINALCKLNQSLNTAYGKVKCRFEEFAASSNMEFDNLRLFHVCDPAGKINAKFTEFLNSKRRKKESRRSHAEHKSEIFSIAKRIISEITGHKKTEERLSIAELLAPAWMEPILDLLPREMPRGVINLRKKRKHRQYPLSLNSELLLESILTVSRKFNIQDVESLFVEHASALNSEIKQTPKGQLPKYLLNTLYPVRKKLGFARRFPPAKSLKLEDWSPKLSNEFEVFEELALNGVDESSELALFAKHSKEVLPLERRISIDMKKKLIGVGLSRCGALPENYGIADLLKLKKRKIKSFGMELSEEYNEYVDNYRKRELNRVNYAKRAGYDSVSFENFRNALISVAKYNGLFPQLKAFRNAYQIKLDTETRRKRKTDKKAAFTLKDIDEQISALEKEFFEITKKGLFMTHPDRGVNETERALKKCLFYVTLITMRYMGLRQRNVRDCRIMKDADNRSNPGGNIGFKKNGTLVFHFTKKETKNEKAIHIELNAKQHGETHGVLIRGLERYFSHVYPYIIKSQPNDVDGQCFVFIPGGSLKFQRFPPESDDQFYYIFAGWSGMFLHDFLRKPERTGITLNPHFFRGLCCDWLHDVLKFSFDQIGEYIGDDAETIKNEYIDRNRVHDATQHVTLKNIELRLSKQEEENRDAFFESIVKRNLHLEQEKDKDKERIRFLEEQIREKERQIDALKKEKADLVNEPKEEDPPG